MAQKGVMAFGRYMKAIRDKQNQATTMYTIHSSYLPKFPSINIHSVLATWLPMQSAKLAPLQLDKEWGNSVKG